jgi:hypothetical protein
MCLSQTAFARLLNIAINVMGVLFFQVGKSA